MTDMTARDQLAQIARRVLPMSSEAIWDATSHAIAREVQEAGWRPPFRTVTTVEEVAALPHMTVIRSALGTVMEKWEDGQWRPTGMHNTWPRVELPATVIYEPEEE